MVAAAMFAAAHPVPAAADALPRVLMYKNPSCGCCGLWADHMRSDGFEVRVVTLDDLAPIKRKAGVPADLETCHTALVGDFTVEGHVPAEAVRRLLGTHPDVVGIGVPGMPAGSPGMPSATPEPFRVIAFAADGSRHLFMSY